MKKTILLLIASVFILNGCGGLKYIKLDQKGDSSWKSAEISKNQDKNKNN